jgi:hypothetical protein
LLSAAPCLARECDCLRALGPLGHSTVVPSSPHSLPQYALLLTLAALLLKNRASVLTFRASFQNPLECSLAALLFNNRAYVLVSRVSFQNPRVCSLPALLFKIRARFLLSCLCSISAPAHLPRFCSITARMCSLAALSFKSAREFSCSVRSCALAAILFNISAYVLVSRPFFQNPRAFLLSCFCSISPLLCTCRASVQNPSMCSIAALLFTIHVPVH